MDSDTGIKLNSKWRHYLINRIINITLILAIMSFIFGIGVKYGEVRYQNEELKANASKLSSLLTEVQVLDKKLNDNALVQEEIRSKLDERVKVVTKEIIRYAQKPTANNKCIDNDWVRIYNSSNSVGGNTSTSKVPKDPERTSDTSK